MKTAVILGGGGQDGFYLTATLVMNDVKVHCLKKEDCDVADALAVERVLREFKPDYIFNLAAKSSDNHEAIPDNHRAITEGTIVLLEAVRCLCPAAKVFLCGSALQFRNTGEPINEGDPFRAHSAYAAQRNGMVYMARYYRDHWKLNIYIGYLFHHDSPLRREHNIAQQVVTRVKEAALGKRDPFVIFNPLFKKEWTYAGDAMDAVWLMVNSEVKECVIGSGEPHTIEEFVTVCSEVAGVERLQYEVVSPKAITVTCDPYLIRELGWKPKVSFRDLAHLMICAEPVGAKKLAPCEEGQPNNG